MNLIDSHDVARTRLYFKNEKVVHLITALQFTLCGMPSIYYGDEVGIGNKDTDRDRTIMRWGDNQDKDILSYHKEIIALRKKHSSLRTGEIEFISDENESILMFTKEDENEKLGIIVNYSDKSVNLDLPEEFKNGNKLYGNDEMKEGFMKEFGISIVKL